MPSLDCGDVKALGLHRLIPQAVMAISRTGLLPGFSVVTVSADLAVLATSFVAESVMLGVLASAGAHMIRIARFAAELKLRLTFSAVRCMDQINPY